jgi:hypothetical protein
MKAFVTAIALSIGFTLMASAAVAQSLCNDRAGMLEFLAKDYKETPIARGMENGGVVLEVLTDAEGKTWTIIVTDPNGVSCAVATGTDWGNVKPPELGPDT